MIQVLKWLCITSMIGTLYGVLEYQHNLFSDLAAVDTTYISYGLWGLLVVVVFEGLRYAITDKNKLEVLTFAATMIGILGTFFGVAAAIGELKPESFDPSNIELVRQMMAGLAAGFDVALNTTITGIFVSLPALAYMYLLGGGNKNEA